jgi:hypothetical protein
VKKGSMKTVASLNPIFSIMMDRDWSPGDSNTAGGSCDPLSVSLGIVPPEALAGGGKGFSCGKILGRFEGGGLEDKAPQGSEKNES